MQISNLPLKFFVPFAANDGAKVEIPVTTATLGRASQSAGFPPECGLAPTAGGKPPELEDFNGAINQIARVTWWQMAGGPYVYDATFASNANINGYPQGAVLPSADLLGSWISIADNNQVNPDTVGTNWVPGYSYGTTTLSGLTNANVTLTPAQAAKNFITLAGTLTGNINIVVPPWAYRWRVTNNTAGAFSVTVKTPAGSGIVIPQNGSPTDVTSNGTNIVQPPVNIAAATQNTHPMQLGQATGRLLRVSVYINVGGVQQVAVNGGIYSTTGATLFQPLGNSTYFEVEGCGGGGGSGGTSATTASQISITGGGGSGAYARSIYTGAIGNQVIVVGAGGVRGGPGNTPGGAGGASSFGSLITCPGGLGSNGGGAGATGATGFVNLGGGATATATGGNITVTQGTSGHNAFYIGGVATAAGAGASSPLGSGGAFGNIASGAVLGTGYGSGGGGTAAQPSSAAGLGFAGSSGVWIIKEYT